MEVEKGRLALYDQQRIGGEEELARLTADATAPPRPSKSFARACLRMKLSCMNELKRAPK